MYSSFSKIIVLVDLQGLQKDAFQGDFSHKGSLQEPSRTQSREGDYGKNFAKFKKCLSTKRRCMITVEDPEEYCSQVSGIVLDFMFKFPTATERIKLLRFEC